MRSRPCNELERASGDQFSVTFGVATCAGGACLTHMCGSAGVNCACRMCGCCWCVCAWRKGLGSFGWFVVSMCWPCSLGRAEDLLSPVHRDEVGDECADILRVHVARGSTIARRVHHGEEADAVLEEGHLLLEVLERSLVRREEMRVHLREVLMSCVQLQLARGIAGRRRNRKAAGVRNRPSSFERCAHRRFASGMSLSPLN